MAALPVLTRIAHELDLPVDSLAEVVSTECAPLPSRLATGALASASVAAATLAATLGAGVPLRIDPARVAVSYRSDQVFRLGGTAPSMWSALSGFWRTSDGWVRTHGNYRHHAAAIRRALALGEACTAGDVEAALLARDTATVVSAVAAERGLAVGVAHEQPNVDAAWRTAPLIEVHRTGTAARRQRPAAGAAASAPLAGLRVLDLTRVIAGPVCTRTLALWGANVLRIDPPAIPELTWQHLDSGHGKRSAVLDAHSSTFRALLATADVVVLGYRPSALDALGLTPEALSDEYPGLVIAQLSAWGLDAGDRRGFDSLVQAESGIAWVESPDGDRPGALPAQALDHSAGYLLAAAITTAVRHRAATGEGSIVRTSLRRIAAELLGMPRTEAPASVTPPDPAQHVQDFVVDGEAITTAAPAIPGYAFAAPRPWGTDQPAW